MQHRIRPLIVILPGLMAAGCFGPADDGSPAPPAVPADVNFTRDIAPIAYQHCVPCHRPGEGTPFGLITYEDLAAHAAQIAEVTGRRYMPPWLPEPGPHPLASERRLTELEIATIAAWVNSGKPRGRPEDLPPPPQFTDGWQIGQPDLVVRMPQAYELPAAGVDVYRNFVIPLPIDRPRWVRGMELQPENRRIVHHAFMLIDRDGECRRLDERDPQPGFDGMETEGAESPDGQFISWQPGKVASLSPAGTAWRLTPGTDLVLQVHMQPTGKPERIQASVGLYFTDQPPTKFPVKLVLRSTEIDIPAGEANYQFEKRFRLPVDVELLGIIPHAHYLGKRLEAVAVYPDGRQEVLLRIPDWDFNWQGDYRFAKPPKLPRGTTLVQRFSYDNSTANVRNPHSPPRPVRYGLRSIDEMGELWFQVLPDTPSDRDILLRDIARHVLVQLADKSRRRLREEPADAKALVDLGKATLALQSPQAAIPFLRRAVQSDPASIDADYYLGHALMASGDLQQAETQLLRVRRIDPQHQMAWHDLGLVYLERGEFDRAESCFRKSLEFNPYHGTTLTNLGLVLLNQNRIAAGIEMLKRATEIRPADLRLRELLDKALRVQNDLGK